jgi:DNA-binding protein H-NS
VWNGWYHLKQFLASIASIFLSLYTHSNVFPPTGETKMAERHGDSVVEWLEIDLQKLSGQERVTLIDARSAFIVEMREKAEQLDLTFEEVLEMGTRPKTRARRETGTVTMKYRSPDGQNSWSGRGRLPVWLKQFEDSGHPRDEFLIKNEG